MAADAFVVVFGLAAHQGSSYARHPIHELVRLALDEAESALPNGPGTPLFVCEALGSHLRILFNMSHPHVVRPLLTLEPRRGMLLGFVERGEGGAAYTATSGQSRRSWESARELVLHQVASFAAGRQAGRR